MPIYAYRCTECGHAQDVLQKISDPILTQCPACGQASYVKQVTAAGFQLKGSGWYVTDFRDGNKGAAKPADTKSPEAAAPTAAGASEGGDKPAGAGAGSGAEGSKGSTADAGLGKTTSPAKTADKPATPAAPAPPAGGG